MTEIDNTTMTYYLKASMYVTQLAIKGGVDIADVVRMIKLVHL